MNDKISLSAEFLFRIDAKATSPHFIAGAPQGDRFIIAAEGGTVKGPALNGDIVSGPGAEWATLREDGSMRVDVRLLIKTDDDALVAIFYNGVAVPDGDSLSIRTAPMFETGAERYKWLNNVQAVGLGEPGGQGVVYDVYRLL